MGRTQDQNQIMPCGLATTIRQPLERGTGLLTVVVVFSKLPNLSRNSVAKRMSMVNASLGNGKCMSAGV